MKYYAATWFWRRDTEKSPLVNHLTFLIHKLFLIMKRIISMVKHCYKGTHVSLHKVPSTVSVLKQELSKQ